MIKIILNNYLRIVRLLLCLLILYCSSCSSLRIEDKKFNEVAQPVFKVIISEQDYPFFIRKIQELNINPIDMQMKVNETQNEAEKLFWMSFRFTSKKEFLVGRSEIMSTGLVSKIVH